MTQAVEADISTAARIIRPEPLHAVGHRVPTVAAAVGVGAGLVGVIGVVVAVIGSGEQSAYDGAAEQSCSNTRTPSSATSTAPAHGLDIRWGSVLECESIGGHRRCIIRQRHPAHCKQCRRS